METIKKHILLLVFLLLPFTVLMMGIIHVSHHHAFILYMLLIVGAYLRNNYLFAFAGFVFLWQVFLFLFGIYNPRLPGIIIGNGFATVIYITAGLIVYVATAKSKIRKETFFNIMCIASIFQALLAYSQWLFGVDPLAEITSMFVATDHLLDIKVMIGSLGNPNFLAAFIAFTLPFFFRKRWVWVLPFLAIVLYQCMASSATLPAIIGVGMFMWLEEENKLSSKLKNHYKYYIAAIALLILIGYFAIDRASIIHSERFTFWQLAVKQTSMFFPTFIFGMGPGAMWAKPFPLHSEWVSCFHQFGLVGLGLFMLYVFSTMRKIKEKALMASFIIIIINFLANSALHYAPTAFLACMIAGLIEREVSWQSIRPSKIYTKRSV